VILRIWRYSVILGNRGTMYKKFIILGLVLLLIGAAAHGWALEERQKEKYLLQQEQRLLNSKLIKLGEPITDAADIFYFADIIPDEHWQQKFARYQTLKETRELVFSASFAFIVIGGTIFICFSLIWISVLVINKLSLCERFPLSIFKQQKNAEKKQETEVANKKERKTSKSKQKTQVKKDKSKRYSKLLTSSGWHNYNKKHSRHCEGVLTKPGVSLKTERLSKESEEIGVLFCDDKSANEGKGSTKDTNLNTKPFDELAQNIRKTVMSDYRENALKFEDSIKTRTKDLEKQMSEFKHLTQTVKEAALENSKPLNNTLEELAQQISAIRAYASHQQDHVKKLQEGYDWNIIRTFCLRVIRCVDNLEKRIALLGGKGVETVGFEEIRDELLFSLESSGVEQFKPEINSEYAGQEKTTEVIKERESSTNAKLTGKIARVIRPGYQYLIDENNVKIVRSAQVKLFG